MKNSKRMLAASVAVLLLILVGCGRQATLPVEEPTPPPPPPPPPQVWEPDTTTFTQVDLEAELARRIAENLVPIYFGFNRHDLTPEALGRLQTAATFLNEQQQIRIRLDGHTDDRGTIEYNLALGERRARSARDALVRFGVDTRRIEMTSFGKERPVRTNCGTNEECHQLNRRVEYTVIRR